MDCPVVGVLEVGSLAHAEGERRFSQSEVMVAEERNALRMRERDSHRSLEIGWQYVRPGGSPC